MTGEVISFNPPHGYGFIEAQGIDYWFHRTEWQLSKAPERGLRVEFDPHITGKGHRATRIRKEK